VLLNDSLAQSVAALWQATPSEWTRPSTKPPRDPYEWAWTGVDLTAVAEDIAGASGIPLPTVAVKLLLLIRTRMVYPDGTVADACRDILDARRLAHTSSALQSLEKGRKAVDR